MTHTVETFGEVTQALNDIQRQLGMHTKIFAGAVALAMAAMGFTYNKLDNVEVIVAESKIRLDNIDEKLTVLNGKLEAVLSETKKTNASFAQLGTTPKSEPANLIARTDGAPSIPLASAALPKSALFDEDGNFTEEWKKFFAENPGSGNGWVVMMHSGHGLPYDGFAGDDLMMGVGETLASPPKKQEPSEGADGIIE
ncbi:MAG: hypothetical protein AAF362_15150 [Pseudomonadota bacterium]